MKKSDYHIAKINHALNKKEKGKLVKIYLDDIVLLKDLKLNNKAAEGLILQVRIDTASNIISYNDLGISEANLNKLLRRQKISNLRIQFYLLKESWYRQEAGEQVVESIEHLIKNGLTWKELRICRWEFYSTKNHIKKTAQ